MKPNTLVQYQGGGYDGCVWEWNFFFIDKDGVFHDVFSSGTAGITTREQAEELLASGKDKRGDFFVCDLTDAKAIMEFNKECNPVNVRDVLRWFSKEPDYGIDFFAVCSACDGHIFMNDEEPSLEDWHGCGGIMSTADKLICSECRINGHCGFCGDYYGEDSEELVTGPQQLKDKWDLPKGVAEYVWDCWAPMCWVCAEDLVNEELGRRIKQTQEES